MRYLNDSMSCNDERNSLRTDSEAFLEAVDNEVDQHILLNPLAEHIHFAIETRGKIYGQIVKGFSVLGVVQLLEAL
jgi:hypothetical protein